MLEEVVVHWQRSGEYGRCGKINSQFLNKINSIFEVLVVQVVVEHCFREEFGPIL